MRGKYYASRKFCHLPIRGKKLLNGDNVLIIPSAAMAAVFHARWNSRFLEIKHDLKRRKKIKPESELQFYLSRGFTSRNRWRITSFAQLKQISKPSLDMIFYFSLMIKVYLYLPYISNFSDLYIWQQISTWMSLVLALNLFLTFLFWRFIWHKTLPFLNLSP